MLRRGRLAGEQPDSAPALGGEGETEWQGRKGVGQYLHSDYTGIKIRKMLTFLQSNKGQHF